MLVKSKDNQESQGADNEAVGGEAREERGWEDKGRTKYVSSHLIPMRPQAVAAGKAGS
jgi:hypothetical protein